MGESHWATAKAKYDDRYLSPIPHNASSLAEPLSTMRKS
jgi:hypothetical protein